MVHPPYLLENLSDQVADKRIINKCIYTGENIS